MAEILTTGDVTPTPVGEDFELNATEDFLNSLITSLLGSIETNVNGSFVRAANGLQVCWATTATDYGSGAATWTYPQAFIETPAVFATARRSDATGSYVHVQSTNYSSTQATFIRSISATVAGFAIGRWK